MLLVCICRVLKYHCWNVITANTATATAVPCNQGGRRPYFKTLGKCEKLTNYKSLQDHLQLSDWNSIWEYQIGKASSVQSLNQSVDVIVIPLWDHLIMTIIFLDCRTAFSYFHFRCDYNDQVFAHLSDG